MLIGYLIINYKYYYSFNTLFNSRRIVCMNEFICMCIRVLVVIVYYCYSS